MWIEKWRSGNIRTFEGEGSGSGGSGDAGTGNGEDGASGSGEGEGTPAPWYGDDLADDLKEIVGDRDAKGFIEYAKSQRQAAGQREADVIEKSGLIKPLGKDDQVGDYFQRFRPGESGEYGKTVGLEGDKVSASDKIEMEAAFEADLHPDQYKRFREKQAELNQTADQEAAQKMLGDLKTDWGADFDANSQAVDRAVKELGLGEDFSAGLASPGLGASPSDFRAVMDGLKTIGLNLKEGPGTTTGEGEHTQTAKQRLDALEAEIIDKGGNATADQQRRRNDLIALVAEEAKEAA